MPNGVSSTLMLVFNYFYVQKLKNLRNKNANKIKNQKNQKKTKKPKSHFEISLVFSTPGVDQVYYCPGPTFISNG